MNLETLTLLTFFFSLMLFIIQRTKPSARRLIIIIMIAPALLFRHYAISRQAEAEAWIALLLAFILNFLFWALVGRYNPVNSKDIHVLGLDD